jgi:anion transporter
MKQLIFSRKFVAAIVLLTAIGVAFCPLIGSSQYARALGLTIFTIGFWATAALPEYLTALVFFALAMLFSVSSPQVIFSGFTSTVIWLVFGGLLLAVAIKRTGLGERIANQVAAKVGKTYATIIVGVVALGTVLSFIIPSSIGRVILLSPIAMALADRFGFARGSKGFSGIVMAAAFGTCLPAFAILPANVPNLVMAGAAETLYGFTPVYGEYLWLHFPVLGFLKAGIVIGLILLLHPDKARPQVHEKLVIVPMSSSEKRLAIVLIVTIAFWLTDFLHHISPAWIGLGAGVICLMPMVGLVPDKAFKEKINFGTLFFLAGIIGLSTMLSRSGVGGQFAKVLLKILPLEPGEPFLNFVSLTAATIVTGIATTLPAVPAVLTPLAGQMAKAAALPVETVLMIQVIGFSTALFPYQAPPLVMAVQLGGLDSKTVVKFCLLISAATFIVLVPIDYLWWRFIGWI